MLKSAVASLQVARQVKGYHETVEEDGSVTFEYGLVIGQIVDQKQLHIVYLARTPTDQNSDDGAEERVVSKFDDVDPDWVGEHVKQVGSMLPGGIGVHGLFFVTKDDIFASKQKLKKLADAVRLESGAGDEKRQFLAAKIDAKTGQVICESMVDEAKKSVNYEEAGKDMAWTCLKTNVILDLPLAFPAELAEKPLSSKVEVLLRRIEKSLANAVVLIRGEFREENDFLVDKSPKDSSFEGDDGDDDDNFRRADEVEADILFDPSDNFEPDVKVVAEVKAKMRLVGRMSVRAFIHGQGRVGEAVSALLSDLVRTLKARLEMHCDSLVSEDDDNDVVEGGEKSAVVVHEPPRRVDIRLPNSAITVSDFLFPGESLDESVKAVEEMFGFAPAFDNLDDELEIVANPKTVMMDGDSESRAESPVLESKKAQQSQCSAFHVFLSVLVVVVAMMVSYIITWSSFNVDDDQDFDHEDGQTRTGNNL